MDLLPLTLRARSNAPMTFDVRLNWSSPRLLEGRLQLQFISGPLTMLRYTTQEMALTNGAQTFRVMTPPAQSVDFTSQMSVRAQFVAKDRTFDLGEFPLFMASKAERSLVICAATALGRLNPVEAKLFQSLRVEAFDPATGEERARSLMTSIADVRAEDLPQHPLGFCSYDVVALTQGGFSAAKEGALKALLRWVRAGGSVCIFLGGDLKEHHVEFLNEVAGAEKFAPAFVLEGSRLGFGDGMQPSGLMMMRAELGRAVLVRRTLDIDHDLNAPPWREARAFLWKVRRAHIPNIQRNGNWGELPASLGAMEGLDRFGHHHGGRLSDFGVVNFPFAQNLSEALMPKTVRLVPFGVIIGLLAALVFAIGPMDYFVLGMFRRRKFTWILFPCVAIAFTIFTVHLSDYYMGRKDYRHSVTIVDVGKGGAVLRETRVELIFAARERNSTTNVKGGIFIPLEQQPSSYDTYTGTQIGGSAQAIYEGHLPMSLRATQPIKQWTPQVNRIFTLDGAARKNDVVDWDAFGESLEMSTGEIQSGKWRSRLSVAGNALLKDKPFDGAAYVFGYTGREQLVASRDSSLEWLLQYVQVRPLPAGRTIAHMALVDWLCSGHGRGINAVTSRLSPTADANLEDLTAVDPTDRDECLLVVVVKRGEDYFIYRRLYHAK
jgi:hypothetical protein